MEGMTEPVGVEETAGEGDLSHLERRRLEQRARLLHASKENPTAHSLTGLGPKEMRQVVAVQAESASDAGHGQVWIRVLAVNEVKRLMNDFGPAVVLWIQRRLVVRIMSGDMSREVRGDVFCEHFKQLDVAIDVGIRLQRKFAVCQTVAVDDERLEDAGVTERATMMGRVLRQFVGAAKMPEATSNTGVRTPMGATHWMACPIAKRLLSFGAVCPNRRDNDNLPSNSLESLGDILRDDFSNIGVFE